jgi:protein-disulfide isomerase
MNHKPWILLIVCFTLSAGIFAFFAATAFKAAPIPKGSETAAATVGSLGPLEQPLVTFIDPSIGPMDAPNLIVEYSDYLCPACRESAAAVKKMVESATNVRYVWKGLPNPYLEDSSLAIEAVLCAKDQGRFWDFHGALFDDTDGSYNQSKLGLMASELGLDVQAFSICLANHEKLPLVERNVTEAKALGLDATPFFFINGERYSGQMSYDRLLDAIK